MPDDPPLSRDLPAAQPLAGRYWIVWGAVLLIGILGRMAHFYVTIGSDDQAYIVAAQDLGGPATRHSAGHYDRIVFLAVLRLWGLPWGVTCQSSAVLMFVLSAVSALLVTLIARRVFGPPASLLAALLYVTAPVSVLYDVVTVPENAALPLMLGSILAFLVFLQKRSTRWVGLAGFLAGVTFGIKEYFPLVFLCFLVVLVPLEASRRLKARWTAVATACLLGGIAVDPALHAWNSGDPLRHFLLPREYSYGMVVRGLSAESAASWGAALSHRAFYLQSLLADFNPASGGVLLLGGLFLLFQWGRGGGVGRPAPSAEVRLLAATAVAFFLFLSLMPVRLRPLAFVEVSHRYSLAFLPLLAIGAGGAWWRIYQSVQEPSLRRSLRVGLWILVGANLWMAGFHWDLGARSSCLAVEKCLAHRNRDGFSTLLLPRDFRLRLPDTITRSPVQLVYAGRDTDGVWEYEELMRQLDSGPGMGVFVPVGLTEVRSPQGEPAGDMRTILEGRQFQATEIRVPGSSYGAWAERLGLAARGKVAGWLYVRKDAGAP